VRQLVAEVDPFHDRRGRCLAGQLGQVADQRGQLLDLAADVVEELGPRRGIQVRPPGLVGLGEQVDVGAQRRQRGAQLMTRVGHQPSLPLARGVECDQHLVERGGQPGDLVVALDRHRGQVLGARDALDRRRQVAYRTEPVARHDPAGETGDQDPQAAEEQGHDAQLGQQLVAFVQWLQQHHGTTLVAGDRDGDHPVLDVGEGGSADALRGLAAGHGVLGLLHAHVRRAVVEDEGYAVLGQEHDLHVGRAQGVRRDLGVGDHVEELVLRRRPGPVDQLGVEGVLELLAHRRVGADGDQGHGQADRDRREQGDPARQRAPVVPCVPVGFDLVGGLVDGLLGHDSFST
jgi:hypothetical protein